MNLETTITSLFPIRTRHYALELVGETVDEDTGEIHGGIWDTGGDWLPTLRLSTSTGEPGTPLEEHTDRVAVLTAATLEDPRAPAFLAGWAEALRRGFAHLDERVDAGEPPLRLRDPDRRALLVRLCDQSAALERRRPRTAEDFTEVLLEHGKHLAWMLD